MLSREILKQNPVALVAPLGLADINVVNTLLEKALHGHIRVVIRDVDIQLQCLTIVWTAFWRIDENLYLLYELEIIEHDLVDTLDQFWLVF